MLILISDSKEDYEVIKESITVMSSKAYTVGKILVEPSYDYLVVLVNPSQLFPSATILHTIEVVSKDSISPPYEIFTQTLAPSNGENGNEDNQQRIVDENRDAKIEDLLSFVSEITKSEMMSKDCKKKMKSVFITDATNMKKL